MLLSVIDLIRNGYLTSNQIHLSDTIETAYCYNWNIYVSPHQKAYPWTPFWHLGNEPFWHFKPIRSQQEVDRLAPPGGTASLSRMRSAILYAYLDDELYELIMRGCEAKRLVEVLLYYCSAITSGTKITD